MAILGFGILILVLGGIGWFLIADSSEDRRSEGSAREFDPPDL
jgi:hypothetical protein